MKKSKVMVEMERFEADERKIINFIKLEKIEMINEYPLKLKVESDVYQKSEDSRKLLTLKTKMVDVRRRVGYSNKQTALEFNLKESSTLFNLLMIFSAVISLALIRYLVLRNTTRTSIMYCKAVKTAVQVYIRLVAVDASLVELFLWDNNSTMNYQTPLDFYEQQRRDIVYNIIPDMKSYETSSSSKFVKDYNKIIYTEMREILRRTDDNLEFYIGTESAMGGIVKNPLISFLSLYINLCDSMVDSWKLAKDKNEKSSILKTDQYASLIAYTIYNSMGTTDAIYYHIVTPIWTFLLKDLETHIPVLEFVNVMTYCAIVVFFVTISRFFFFKVFSSMRLLINILYSIPVRLIDDHMVLKRAMKTEAHLYSYMYWHYLRL